jgi:poly(A) polymerase
MATGGAKRVGERARVAAEQAASRIVRTLRERGHMAYLAGGCVRDLLLGLRPSDYDVATSATPDEVLAIFDDAHEVGKAFGVVLVRFGRGKLEGLGDIASPAVSVEVATFRREGVYTDNRRPDRVEFCGPDEDAKRRDFTINALFLDPLGDGPARERVIDLVGGLSDLGDGVIRAVGDAAARLEEDHLRALRAVRFAARLGFAIEAETGRAIREHASRLKGVSEERVGDELRRMLGRECPVPSRRRAIELLEELGLADPVLGTTAGPGWEPKAGPALRHLTSPTEFAAVLACWVHDREGLAQAEAKDAAGRLAEIGRTLRRGLKLSNEEVSTYSGVGIGLEILEEQWSGAGVAARKRWASAAWFEDAMVLVAGRKPGLKQVIEGDVEGLRADGIGLSPQAWVTGEDLIESGLEPGPDFRIRLDRAFDAQLDGRAKTRTEALRIAMADPEGG